MQHGSESLIALHNDAVAAFVNRPGFGSRRMGPYIDPDLVTYWLSDEIDESRGWGIRDDGFVAFERLKQLGAPDWFGLARRFWYSIRRCWWSAYFRIEVAGVEHVPPGAACCSAAPV